MCHCFRCQPGAAPISLVVWLEMADTHKHLYTATLRERVNLSDEKKECIAERAVIDAEEALRQLEKKRRKFVG